VSGRCEFWRHRGHRHDGCPISKCPTRAYRPGVTWGKTGRHFRGLVILRTGTTPGAELHGAGADVLSRHRMESVAEASVVINLSAARARLDVFGRPYS
jgi:hypothetical protein